MLFKENLDYPETFFIEASSLCNFNCPLCLWSLNKKHGFLLKDTLKNILYALPVTINRICFSGRGEPTLNKDICELLKMCTNLNITIDLQTNGSSLEEKAEDLLLTGIDNLNVSIDADNENDYNKYRINGDFQKIIRGMERIAALKTKMNLQKPVLRTVSVIFNYNENRLDRMKVYFKEIGFEKYVFKSAHLGHGQIDDNELARKWLPENGELKRKTIYSKAEQVECDFLNKIHIYYDGSVSRCAISGDQMIIGNVNDAGFDTLWKSKENVEVLDKINKGMNGYCEKCEYRGRKTLLESGGRMLI